MMRACKKRDAYSDRKESVALATVHAARMSSQKRRQLYTHGILRWYSAIIRSSRNSM